MQLSKIKPTFEYTKTPFMKLLPFSLMVLFSLVFSNVKSQYFEPENPTFNFITGAGVASYYGDLTEKAKLFNQSSYSFSTGFSYKYNRYFEARLEFSLLEVKGFDSKNNRVDLKARNLSFKSNVWDINLAVDYNILGLNEDRKFSPYVFLGVGISHFNPYTTDRTGAKVYLQPLGTEGQGLSMYPNRKPYSLTNIQLPFGAGVKYAVTPRLVLQLELKYRYLDTDYLDDVSNASYPDLAALTAANPKLPGLAYRGDELPGGADYPTKGTLNRGNPNKKDSYYSTQFKIAYQLSAKGKGFDILY